MKHHLSPWARQAVEHWRKYRPTLYAQLFRNGELYARAQRAADQTRHHLYGSLLQPRVDVRLSVRSLSPREVQACGDVAALGRPPGPTIRG